MKVLIVSRSFFPMNAPRAFRTTELAKEFSRQGHNVTVVTQLHPLQNKIAEEYGINFVSLGKLKWNQIIVPRKGFKRLIKRIQKRFLGLYFYFPHIELTMRVPQVLKRLESNYDLLISIAAPHSVHWGVARVIQKLKSKGKVKHWIADCGDPFMGSQNDTFKKPFYFSFIEKWWNRNADAITVPIEQARKGYYPVAQDKITVIPQGFCFDDFPTAKKNRTQVTKFCYAGGLTPGKRDPRQFLKLLTDKFNDCDYEFHIYTPQQHLVRPYVKKSSGKLIIHDVVPRSEILSIMSEMDFLVNFQNESKIQSPSKLIDYIILEKPVLNVASQNIDIIAVSEFLDRNFANKMQLPNKDIYDINNIVKQFCDLMNHKKYEE